LGNVLADWVDGLFGDPDAERLPDRRQPEHQQHNLLGAGQRPNIVPASIQVLGQHHGSLQ
jgi:hypothetical protein